MFDAFRGRRVLVTGHTGFKGSWLVSWLLHRRAEVMGFALDPPTNPSLYAQLGLASKIEQRIADIRHRREICECLVRWQPEIIFHLAAQPLVRKSYDEPIETFDVNVMGTLQLLDAIRTLNRTCVVVVVTSDKCYRNHEWEYAYRENDALGGKDPYSCSKAMTELAVDCYRNSFLHDAGIYVASVRAGNVIGGGDWAEDRIVPDAIRALSKDHSISVRNPHSSRPWQHVLEPLHGYLRLAARIVSAKDEGDRNELCSAFNFGPPQSSNVAVATLIDCIAKTWSAFNPSSAPRWEDDSDPDAPHEARLLHVASDKAHHLLDWRCVWSLQQTVEETISWYHRVRQGEAAMSVTLEQIQQFESLA
ncbi:CDP-glucose 4,6-dehydratase [Roseiconus nitratireducens]|uniref:CDP-glucose 4,6-dehydratase n=1 Tax=Roseiconus nitratireducens TaxID=2605748 RepID=A0A5M6D4M6_9BACT|nr:CDP-glucose 4,6-dehydratase [Roseiconus nitratireducens]